MKERLNREQLYRTLKSLDIFLDKCFNLCWDSETLTGFNFTHDLIYAAVANTYVETIGNKADSLHRRIKMSKLKDISTEYLETIQILGQRVDLKNQDVVVAFDYTEEDFYGDLQGFWLHGCPKERSISGKFKFLTCAIVCTTAPIRVPVISVPVYIGHSMAATVLYCLELVRCLVHSITLVLFDRGFYSKDLMIQLSKSEFSYPYLIFVPRTEKVKKELALMSDKEKKTITYEFELRKNKTTLRGETTLAFLKQIYDKRAEKNFDWTFATNVDDIDLETIIKTYKKRWRIETMFRVQDEAHIMTKSKDIRIRFFYFVYAQVLQLYWAVIFKEKVGFKEFLILLNETAKERDEKAKRRRIKRAVQRPHEQ